MLGPARLWWALVLCWWLQWRSLSLPGRQHVPQQVPSRPCWGGRGQQGLPLLGCCCPQGNPGASARDSPFFYRDPRLARLAPRLCSETPTRTRLPRPPGPGLTTPVPTPPAPRFRMDLKAGGRNIPLRCWCHCPRDAEKAQVSCQVNKPLPEAGAWPDAGAAGEAELRAPEARACLPGGGKSCLQGTGVRHL